MFYVSSVFPLRLKMPPPPFLLRYYSDYWCGSGCVLVSVTITCDWFNQSNFDWLTDWLEATWAPLAHLRARKHLHLFAAYLTSTENIPRIDARHVGSRGCPVSSVWDTSGCVLHVQGFKELPKCDRLHLTLKSTTHWHLCGKLRGCSQQTYSSIIHKCNTFLSLTFTVPP